MMWKIWSNVINLTLLGAYEFSRQLEQTHLAAVKRHVLAATQKGARPNQFQQGSRQAPTRDNWTRAPNDKGREPKKCWCCPKNWFYEHKCKGLQRAWMHSKCKVILMMSKRNWNRNNFQHKSKSNNKYPIPVIEDLLDDLQGAGHYINQIGPQIMVPSNKNASKRCPQNCIQNTSRALWVSCNAFWAYKCTSNIPSHYEQHLKDTQGTCTGVLWWHTDLQQKHKTACNSSTPSVGNILRKNKLVVKKIKRVFAQPVVEYLGHIISSKGVAIDPSKIAAIIAWKQPTTLTKLRSFLGMTSYYKRFIRNYSSIRKPLHDMLKKEAFH